MINGLPIHYDCWLFLVIESAELENSLRLYDHKKFLKSPKTRVCISQKNSFYTVGFPPNKVDKLQVLFLADRCQPPTFRDRVPYLLHIQNSLTVIADPAVEDRQVVDGEEHD